MKISNFYYLSYPDCDPPDPLIASSEVYFEGPENNASIDCLNNTYSVNICTFGYIKQQLELNPFFIAKSTIIIERFEDSLIKVTLEAILPIVITIAELK